MVLGKYWRTTSDESRSGVLIYVAIGLASLTIGAAGTAIYYQLFSHPPAYHETSYWAGHTDGYGEGYLAHEADANAAASAEEYQREQDYYDSLAESDPDIAYGGVQW